MLYCLGSGQELLSAATVLAVCHDSSVFLVRLYFFVIDCGIVKVKDQKSMHVLQRSNLKKKVFSVNIECDKPYDYNNCYPYTNDSLLTELHQHTVHLLKPLL